MAALFLIALTSTTYAGGVEEPILTAPVFPQVGDRFTYAEFSSLNDAKQGENSRNKATYSVETEGPGFILKDVDSGTVRFFNKDGNMVSVTGSRGTTKFNPAIRTLSYPLSVGKSWDASYKMERGSHVIRDSQLTAKVVGWEEVTVPAGTFMCLKIKTEGTYTYTYRGRIYSGNTDTTTWVAQSARWRPVLTSTFWVSGSRSGGSETALVGMELR
ncbi:MAG: hypothetical protein OQJ98_02940, partial [Candidatus Pacebacteria bacterium]|nr:hypothetical protein [Candidatus Paceibacterota bacterium]